jgi:hypothetical protein
LEEKKMKAHQLVAGIAVALLLSSAALADVDFQITEVYVGLSGEDGTEDWIEVTNMGDMAGDTGTLIYDDESFDPDAGGDLPSFTLEPGESAVFLVAAGDPLGYPDAISEFEGIWGAGMTIGATDAGGLSQNGDIAVIMTADGTILDAVAFDDTVGGQLATIDSIGDTPMVSQLGVHGAYESNPFFNDNIGDPPNYMISLVGSPGLIPEPASLLLLAVAGLIRRR